MIYAQVIKNKKTKMVTINQKHICSFEFITLDEKKITELRMSNGDIWHVIDPPCEDWVADSFVTDVEY